MNEGFTYKHLDNDIHQIYWADVEKKTVDAYIKLFFELHDNFPTNGVLRILHDYRDTGTPSFTVIANAMKSFKIREDITLRIAHLYSDSMYPMIMKNASMVARFDTNRSFFNADEEQQAIEWLLAD